MRDNGDHVENPDAPKRAPLTPEQRAVSDLVERIINPERPEGNWGIGRFVKLKQRLLALKIEKDDVRHLYVADGSKREEGLYPFRVDETVAKREADSAILSQVRLHPKILEETGIYGYVAALGREEYERLKGEAEADSQVDKIKLRQARRDAFSPKAGLDEWIAQLRAAEAEDWITVSEKIPDDGPIQPDFRWYYQLDTDAPRKRLPRRLAVGRRAGQRYVGKLVEPYIAEIPEDVEFIWSTADWTLQNPPQ